MDLTNASIITEQRKAGQHLDCCRILSRDNVCIYFYSSPLITLKENSTMVNSNIAEKEKSVKIFTSSYISIHDYSSTNNCFDFVKIRPKCLVSTNNNLRTLSFTDFFMGNYSPLSSPLFSCRQKGSQNAPCCLEKSQIF